VFLLAVMLPCVVVIALGLRLVAQDRELAETRVADERRQFVADVRRQLLGRLESIARAAAVADLARDAIQPDAVVLVAPIHGGRMLLPWEPRSTPTLGEPGAQDRARAAIDEGERLEARQPTAAASSYRRAVTSADPAIATYAEFCLARALRRAGEDAAADALDRQLAARSFDLADEYGVPFAIYAAQRLTDRAERLPPAFFDHSHAAVRPAQWLSPTAAYALQGVASRVAAAPFYSDSKSWAADVDRLARARVDDANLLMGLQRTVAANLPRRTATEDSDPEWFTFGSPSWLASIVSRADRRSAVVVDAGAILASLPATPNFTDRALVDDTRPGEVLGEGFTGVRFAYAFDDRGGTAATLQLRRWFYLTALVMVVSLTMLGGYLLSRDARRERRIADMRAQFLASVSHELRTPLTSVRMFTDTLRMGRGLDERTRSEYLDTIASETERLTRLLNNVLDFSRIEEQRKTYHFTPTSLPEVLRAAARAMAYPLAQAGFELHVRVDEAVPPIEADADALEQAVLNLLTNAMKYSGTSRHIDLALDHVGDRAVISVTDRGIGIPPRDQARVFERFYRVPLPEGQQIPGTGLGLTIVQHIVDAHHGRISVSSAPGSGATFTIALPLPDRPGTSHVA
jgi:signal transduction histidine kinase